MKPVVHHHAAEKELGKALRYYAGGSAQVGLRFGREVDAAILGIPGPPHLLRKESDGARSVRVEGFPYRIVFVERLQYFEVIAIAHMRRRPGYWRRRL